MSVHAPNKREIEREDRLLRDPVWQAERLALGEPLSKLGEASDDHAFFDVRVSLVARLKARQNRLGELRAEITPLQARRRELAAIRPKPEAELRVVQRELEDVEWQAEVQRDLHCAVLQDCHPSRRQNRRDVEPEKRAAPRGVALAYG